MSLVAVGICVQCYTQYEIELQRTGSSDITFMFNDIDDVETHLRETSSNGGGHLISQTLAWGSE